MRYSRVLTAILVSLILAGVLSSCNWKYIESGGLDQEAVRHKENGDFLLSESLFEEAESEYKAAIDSYEFYHDAYFFHGFALEGLAFEKAGPSGIPDKDLLQKARDSYLKAAGIFKNARLVEESKYATERAGKIDAYLKLPEADAASTAAAEFRNQNRSPFNETVLDTAATTLFMVLSFSKDYDQALAQMVNKIYLIKDVLANRRLAVLFQLADIFIRQGEFNRARMLLENYQKVGDYEKNLSAIIHYKLGRIALAKAQAGGDNKDYQEAVQEFTWALEGGKTKNEKPIKFFPRAEELRKTAQQALGR